MKIKVRVVTDMEMDFQLADLDMAKRISQGFEAGWRMGAAKDLSMLKEVLRQQYGLTATVDVPVIFCDFTFVPSEQKHPVGLGKTGVTHE
jgi:hypothetical protein